MLRVKCPSCDHVIRCSQEHAGEQVQCPGCEHRFVVPFDTPNYEAKPKVPESAPAVVAEALPGKLDDTIQQRIIAVSQTRLKRKLVVRVRVHFADQEELK